MSSEESGQEDDSPIVVRPLPWRASRFDSFLGQLNRRIQEPQARRQTKGTVVGAVSRHQPVGTDISQWAFNNQT